MQSYTTILYTIYIIITFISALGGPHLGPRAGVLRPELLRLPLYYSMIWYTIL